MSVGTLDTLAEDASVGTEGGGIVPKLGLCFWAGSRVGLLEKHLLVNRDQVWDLGDRPRLVLGV